MTRQAVRFIVIVVIQLLILGAIIFFPESEKKRLFSTFTPVARPDIEMELVDDPVNDIVAAIDEAGLFDRYRWTRAIGVERPREAIVVLPDRRYEEHWHFERFLSDAHATGIGAVILDLRDVAEFVPLRAPDGSLRSTDERVTLFADATRSWLLGLGFSEIAIVSFGSGAGAALDLIESSGDFRYLAWVDITGNASANRWEIAKHATGTWPSTLFVSGQYEDDLVERLDFLDAIASKGSETRHRPVLETGEMLLDPSGMLDSELESAVVAEAFDWIAGSASN